MGGAPRRAARAGEVRDLRRAGPRARRDGDRGRDPARRAHAGGPVRRVHRLQPGRARARGRAGQGHHPPRAARCFQDITVAHLDHMLLSTIPMEANLYRAVRAMVPSVKAVRVPGPLHLLRLDRAAPARPGQERDPRRARRRPLHEARGGGGPRRGRLRRPPGELGHRHPLPARPRHHDHHQCARLGPRPLHQARTATPPSGAWTPPPSPPSPPTRRATACRPRSWQRLDLKDFVAVAAPPVTPRRQLRRAARPPPARRRPEHPALVWDGGALYLARARPARAAGVARRARARRAWARAIAWRCSCPTAGASPSRSGRRSRLGATVAPAQPAAGTPTERARILGRPAAAHRRGRDRRAEERADDGRVRGRRRARRSSSTRRAAPGRPRARVLSHAALDARATNPGRAR